MELKDQRVLCIDNGLFTYVAEAIAPAFKKLEYWSPWITGFPKKRDQRIGTGLPGVHRVNYWLGSALDADLIIYPDCYHGPDQVVLAERLHKRVWGARMAEDLELDREGSKEALDEVGVPIGPFAVCTGMEELRDYLKKAKHPVIVKIPGRGRGDKESFAVSDYRLAEYELIALERDLGPDKVDQEFIVEDCIDPAAEIAGDFFVVDDQYPEAGMWGVEAKGRCYCGMVCDVDRMPKQITENLKRVAPMLKAQRCRSWFGMETRVDESGTAYVIDPLARFGNPPGGLCTLMYTNLAQIMSDGADGKMCQPVFMDKVGVQVQVYSEWSADEWQPVYFPDEVAPYVKLQYHRIKDGVHFVAPTADKNMTVGSIVACGKTIDECIEKASGYAKQVEGPGIKIDCKVLSEVKEEFSNLKRYGITV